MKKWVIYCRVSTLEQETNSLIKQELSCRNLCNHNRIEIIWVYIEKSLWNEKNRSILNEAINCAKENKTNYFITYKLNRLSRKCWVIKEVYNDLKESSIKLIESKNRI